MARHRGGVPRRSAAEMAAREAAAAASKAKTGPKKKGVRGVSDEAFVRRLDELKEVLRTGEWPEDSAPLFVALYADLYFRVYGVEPLDLGKVERAYATKLARDVLANDFDGKPREMAEFVAWTWSREKGREQWRRENNRDGGRVTWRAQFGRAIVADYRMAAARKAAAKEVRAT